MSKCVGEIQASALVAHHAVAAGNVLGLYAGSMLMLLPFHRLVYVDMHADTDSDLSSLGYN